MALWGKGDPRWIVEERPDSKNVNNWHWTERDATLWSKTKLKTLFSEAGEETEEGNWKIEEVKKVEGEASINNRKGKLIYFYEWAINLEYKGKLADSELCHSGSIEIPNLSDENTADEVDVRISAKGDSKNGEKLKQFVRKNGINVIRGLCAQYVVDMKTEYSSGMVLPTKNGNAPSSIKDLDDGKKVNSGMRDMNFKDTSKKSKNSNSQHVSLCLKEEFYTNAEELYLTLTETERLSAFTGSKCTSTATNGGEFSIMGGNITGTYIELIPNKKISQKWRFKEWPDGVVSVVTIDLDQKSDSTWLSLNQTGVPDYDISKTEEGWKRHFWGPIKHMFGFGAQLF